jgi:uncharacterized protein (DUF2249 family)/hemerythrin-like domain-containing protein
MPKEARRTDAAQAIRDHHRKISEELDVRVRSALDRGTSEDLAALVALLEGELLGHARAEQRHLYPVVDELVRQHGRATATMDIDHETIATLVERIAAEVERLRAARQRQERMEAKALLREALLRLETLLHVHLAKEERVYLPLIERCLSADAQALLLEQMEGRSGPGSHRANEIDVRDIAQRDRHRRVFEEFDRLAVGESLDVVSDHDPRPLSYQFARKRRGAYAWDYVERGPIWRVRITRTMVG